MTLAPAAGSLVRVCGGWLLVQTYEDITAKRQHTRGFSWCLAPGPDRLASVHLGAWTHPDRHALNLIPGPFPDRTTK